VLGCLEPDVSRQRSRPIKLAFIGLKLTSSLANPQQPIAWVLKAHAAHVGSRAADTY
jgi:hypothetical protein